MRFSDAAKYLAAYTFLRFIRRAVRKVKAEFGVKRGVFLRKS